MITNILLLTILLVLLSVIGFLIYEFFKFWRMAIDFITPQEEGKPSPLALAVDAGAIFLARALLAQAKGFLMGLQSGQARGEKAVQADLVEGLAGQNPITALLMSFPALRKTIRRNPALMDVALNTLVNKAGVSGLVVGQGNNHNGEQPKFNL